jgi:predicted nucleic acid-binding protein
VARKVVLADASPLIALARVDGLPWLRKLYKTISITKEVRIEATAARELPGAVAIAAALKQGWIRVLRQESREPPLPQLDTGEASTLRAAVALGPGALVLLDDLQARRTAQRLGIAMIGTAGIIVEARQAGLIPAVRPVFARLAEEGFHLGDELLQAILAEVGER